MINSTINNTESNSNPRELEANRYLEDHRILELLNNMTAMLIFARPEDPKVYLIEQLEKLKLARQSGIYYPCLFDETNLNSIFGMLDPTKRGFISKEQYNEALKTIGACDFNEHPIGADVNRITLDTFIKEAKNGLSNAAATFKF